MVKVFINPDYSKVPPHADNGGIRRVAEAQVKHLPKFDIEVVHDPKDADVICNHGSSLKEFPGKPIVNVNHGLYWSRQPWGDGYQEVNAEVVESMAHAVAHTAPSEWVANAIRRGSMWYPEVVYHGVDGAEFLPGKTNGGYVLWNKARADYVSDPTDMMNVSFHLPERQFFTTIGKTTSNVRVLGVQDYLSMKKLVSEAGVYLATARETFGIGTLEAMAYGVPIAGWNWGGQKEIVIPGETGYLAPPGDFRALAEAIERCIADRDRLSANCVADARARWAWEPRIEQYANIFKSVYDRYVDRGKKPRISVIVTAYKLDQYLPQCLESVRQQTYGDFECLVIDDAQLDSTKAIVRTFAKDDRRFKYVATPNNFGLVGSRNFGLEKSKGLYIRHLDADDYLASNCLALEAEALDKNNGIHIVYGHMALDTPQGIQQTNWPHQQFNWMQQMTHMNQVPSCAMARRQVYENVGGYRERMKRAEDAEFWCRATSFGFRAKKITQAVTYYHRMRDDSKGALEWKTEGQEPDWTSWFPWRLGASTGREADEIVRKYGNDHPKPHIVPFAAQGKAPNPLKFWYVHDYAYPVVSIIVTCGPGHKHYLQDALDSIQAQSYTDWECVVVNDTGAEWPADIMGAPWAKVVNMPGNKGAAAARNAGYKHIHGKLVVWMDADDYWMPWYLEKMVGSAEVNDGVIFSDLLLQTSPSEFKVYRYDEFDCSRVAVSFRYPGTSVLIPRKITEQVRWDESCPGMEDWDFAIQIHDKGFCAYRLPEPLFVYRTYSSTKREKDHGMINEIVNYMDEKWSKYRKDGVPMGCGCGQKSLPRLPVSAMTASGNFQTSQGVIAQVFNTAEGQMITLSYEGPLQETFSIRSRVAPGVVYRFGNNSHSKVRAVFIEDAEYLLSLTNPDATPQYIATTAGATMEVRDPASVLGQAIQA